MDLRIKRPEIRVSRCAQRGLSVLVERVPQAEAFGRRVGRRIGRSIGRPINEKLHLAFTWLYGARRRLATVAVAVVTVWLFLHVMFGANGMVVYRQRRAEYLTLSREIDQLQKENDHYTGQIKFFLNDTATTEKE